jgi:hypothetical protein
MPYREAREFAAAVFPDKDLMTYRNGKRALTHLVMNADRLDRLKYTKDDDDREVGRGSSALPAFADSVAKTDPPMVLFRRHRHCSA